MTDTPTKKRGPPKGTKLSQETRLKILDAWANDPARKQKYLLRQLKRGRVIRMGQSRAGVETDFDEDM